jgi:hypothetical protein
MDGTLTLKVETSEHFKREMARADENLAKLERMLRGHEHRVVSGGVVGVVAAAAVAAGSSARVSRRRLFSFGLLK